MSVLRPLGASRAAGAEGPRPEDAGDFCARSAQVIRVAGAGRFCDRTAVLLLW